MQLSTVYGYGLDRKIFYFDFQIMVGEGVGGHRLPGIICIISGKYYPLSTYTSRDREASFFGVGR